ncbi:hypothetical protein F4859DRAFT_516563 [Xylaria cf. heliscus]|nr:hypothetical protein F4859DRAFT_516563 [Xylaria cf. heliscus]
MSASSYALFSFLGATCLTKIDPRQPLQGLGGTPLPTPLTTRPTSPSQESLMEWTFIVGASDPAAMDFGAVPDEANGSHFEDEASLILTPSTPTTQTGTYPGVSE